MHDLLTSIRKTAIDYVVEDRFYACASGFMFSLWSKMDHRISDALRRSLTLLTVTMFCIVAASGCVTKQSVRKDGAFDSSRGVVRQAAADADMTYTIGAVDGSPMGDPKARRVSISGMNLSEAVGIAISRHPDISRANAVVTQSASELAIAKAAWYPTIGYSLRPGYGQSYNSSGSKIGAQGSFGVNQLIYDFGRTPGAISAADATLSEQRHLFDNTVASVAYNTAEIFVELAASQDMIAAAQRQIVSLKKIRSRIDERLKAGLSDSSDQMQADIAIQRAEADALAKNNRFDVAAGKLAELVGVRPTRIAGLAETRKLVSHVGGGSEGDLDQTPAVMAANAALDAAEAKVRVAKAERWPQIGIGASRTVSTSSQSGSDDVLVGITIGGSFSLSGLAHHKITAAEAEKNAAAQSLENERLVTRTALKSAETEALGAAARLASYDRVIALTKSSRDLYWQEYTLNKRPLTEVINAERDVFTAEEQRTTALADGILAEIKAYTAVGRFTSLLRAYERGLK